MAGLNNLFAMSQLIGAGGNMASSFGQASASRAQGNYERQIMETNSRLAEFQAEDAMKRGDKASVNIKDQTKRLIGSQRVAMAAQGLDLSSGDPLAIQEETAAIGAEDAMTARNNAWREAWGYKTQALDYSGRGKMAQVTAKNKAANTILTGGLNSAKDIMSGYYTFEMLPEATKNKRMW
jgi:superfamily II RNA helicase